MANCKHPDRDRKCASRGVDPDTSGEFDPACSPTTPLAFNGSPLRRPSYVRSQSLINGRIQKPSVARSQSFNGIKCAKPAHRSHHMETLQAQLLLMKATGVDQKKFVEVLEKLKDTYHSRSDKQQQHKQHYQQQSEDRRTVRKSSVRSSPLSSNQTFEPRVEDRPAEASTIALLQNKFAQLKRYRESIQGQQIQVYPNHNFRSGHSSTQHTPVSSSPSSPRVGFEDESYSFDEGTAALLAVQQEMMSNSSRAKAANSGMSEDVDILTSQDAMAMGMPRSPLNISQSMRTYRRSPLHSQSESTRSYMSPLHSQSESSWSACESPDVSESMSPQGDEAANALLHYMLQPPNVGRPPHNTLTAFQNMSLRDKPATNMGSAATRSGSCTTSTEVSLEKLLAAGSGSTTITEEVSLEELLAAERMEILMAKKAAAAAEINNVGVETKVASSIQQVVARFPFNLAAKFSSPKSKLQGAWGRSLSLNTPVVPPSCAHHYSGDGSWESDLSCESSQTCRSNESDVQWYNSSGRDCSNDMYVRQQDLIDTSLHL